MCVCGLFHNLAIACFSAFDCVCVECICCLRVRRCSVTYDNRENTYLCAGKVLLFTWVIFFLFVFMVCNCNNVFIPLQASNLNFLALCIFYTISAQIKFSNIYPEQTIFSDKYIVLRINIQTSFSLDLGHMRSQRSLLPKERYHRLPGRLNLTNVTLTQPGNRIRFPI